MSSFIKFFDKNYIPSGGHAVPGNLLKNPVLDPKYCQDNAGSLSKLFANKGSKWEDQRIAD